MLEIEKAFTLCFLIGVFFFFFSFLTFYSLKWCANLHKPAAGWQINVQSSYSDAAAFTQWRLLVQEKFLSKLHNLALWHFWQMESMKNHSLECPGCCVCLPSVSLYPVYGLILSGFKLLIHRQSPTFPPDVYQKVE